MNDSINPKAWEEIQSQFEKLKIESGVEPEEDYIKELEDMFGMSLDEMNRETEILFKSI